MKVIKILLAALGFGLLGIVFLYGLATYSPSIENDILTRAKAVFKSSEDKIASMFEKDEVALDVDGRDLTIKGFVDSKEKRARLGTIASSVEGVRSVSNKVLLNSKTATLKPLSEKPSSEKKKVVQKLIEKIMPKKAMKKEVAKKEITPKAKASKTAALVQAPSLKDFDINKDVELVELDTEPVKSCFGQYAEVISSGNVSFIDSSLDLSDESLGLLGKLADTAQQCQGSRIKVLGHTGSAGDVVANKTLSTKRAQVVASYLLNNGVSSNRLSAKGYGQSRPLESNITEAGRAANDRIEITIEEIL